MVTIPKAAIEAAARALCESLRSLTPDLYYILTPGKIEDDAEIAIRAALPYLNILANPTEYLCLRKGVTTSIAELSREELEQEVCLLMECLESYSELASQFEVLEDVWRNSRL